MEPGTVPAEGHRLRNTLAALTEHANHVLASLDLEARDELTPAVPLQDADRIAVDLDYGAVEEFAAPVVVDLDHVRRTAGRHDPREHEQHTDYRYRCPPS